MENSPFGTLEEPTTFPPHRRRPLRGQTFHTLLHILSHCHAHSQQSQSVPEVTKSDNGGNELGPDTEFDELLANTSMESHELLHQKESLAHENREVLSVQEGIFSNTHVQIDRDFQDIEGGNKELAQMDVSNLVNSVENKNQSSYNNAALTSHLEDQLNCPELPVGEINGGIIVKTSYSSGHTNEKSPQGQTNALEDTGDDRQCTVMELKRSVPASDAVSSLTQLTADEEVEEGEISGEDMSFSHEDAMSCEEKTGDKLLFSEELMSKEQEIELEKDPKSIPLSVDTIDKPGKGMDAETRVNKRNLVDYSEMFVPRKTVAHVGGASGENTTKNHDIASTVKDAVACNKKKRQGLSIEEKIGNKKLCSLQDKSEIVVHGKYTEPISAEVTGRNIKQKNVVKESIHPSFCPENLPPLGEPSWKQASQNEINPSPQKDDTALEKKKKRVLTKERRAKKKQKERIKRAEKNRKLGVKRLKLQPVIKPKTVTYCRHYLKGRCHEGENCKFSHDTIPLTKSKPCCHFARHSCMKGDDCPFDHQLSKYPCNNYLSTGSCNRGEDCMFSHEMPATEGSSPTLNDSRPQLKSLSVPDNSSSKKQLKVHGPSHEIGAKSGSIALSPCKSTEQNLIQTTPKAGAQTPKGISFLSQGKSSLEAGLSSKIDDGVKIDHQMIHGASDTVRGSNEITKATPVVLPRGINFLSFGKRSPINELRSRVPFKRDDGIAKSPLSNSCNGEKLDSSLKSADGVKLDSLISECASDDTSNMKLIDLHNKDNPDAVSVQERECVRGKSQIPDAIPLSSVSDGPFLDRLADGQSNATPSLNQKLILPNTPCSLQKKLQATLAFASKFQSGVKMCRSIDGPVSITKSSTEVGSSPKISR